MALLHSRQIDHNFTGSYNLSGSSQSLISNQVVVGSNLGSAVAHPSASMTILLGDKKGFMIPSGSSDPSSLSTTEKGMMFYNNDDSILKIFDGTAWIPAGDINTKNTHLSMSADIDGNGANSTMIFRIDGVSDSNVKLRLKSDDTHEMTGSLNLSGSLTVEDAIYSKGDTDTYIDYSSDDEINFWAGGERLLKLDEGTTDEVVVGDGGDVNFRVATTGYGYNLYVKSSNAGGVDNSVGIRNSAPQSVLDITGDLHVSSHITSSANISSSGTITAEQLTTSDDLTVGDKITTKNAEVEVALTVNTDASGAGDFRAKSQNLNHMLFVDSNKDKVGIGFNSPGGSDMSSSLHVSGDVTATHVTASGDISASGDMTTDNLTVAGRVQGDLRVTGDVLAETYIVSSSVTYLTQSFASGSHMFGDTLDDTHEFTGSMNVTGSSALLGTTSVTTPLTSSTAITTNNITNGYPTSNRWGTDLDGSYFNNFDNTTHVSEILRFIAGAMSHSLDVADASPNTKYWNTLSTSHTEGSTTSKNSLLDGVLGSTYEDARLSQHWTSSAFIDFSETGSYKEVQNYLLAKGWVVSGDLGTWGNDTGTNPFHGSYASRIPSTIQTQATLGTNSHTVTANAGGSSTVYSNSNYFGMGGLTSGGATAFYVRTMASHSFSDNYADATPDEDSTYTTASYSDYSISSFGTSNGLVLAKIITAQPAVIPSAYQDGDFNSVAGPISGRIYTGGATSATSLSASGYYATHDIKTGLKSGSQSDYVFKNGSDSNTRFYLYAGGLPSDITNSQPTAVVTSSADITAFSATSRSFSGAPYLLTTTYTVTFESEVTKSFDPCYGYGSSVLVNSNTTDEWENIGSTTLSNTTTTVNNSGVSSTGATNYVIDSTKTTKRSSSGTPHVSDIAVASSSLSFTLDSNTENIDQNRSSDESQNYSLIFRARGRNWKNTAVDATSPTFSLYDASRFGQVAASGSMAVYSRAQGYDSNTLQDTTETFTGEDFRIVLADNVQAFNGAYFTTNSFVTNDEGDSVLGDYDLQVKPGYLVEPGGDYGYWFAEDFGSGTYKYYIRRFQTPGSTYSSMTLDVGKTLVNWAATTSDSVAATILYESSGNGSGNNASLGVARIYDPTKLVSNLIEADMAADNFKNPFSTAISLYGNTGGSKSSTEYTIPIRNADGMYLDASDNELYVIIRYKGDPSPVTSITLSYS